jgi:hypothetical protein
MGDHSQTGYVPSGPRVTLSSLFDCEAQSRDFISISLVSHWPVSWQTLASLPMISSILRSPILTVSLETEDHISTDSKRDYGV